MDLSRRRIFVSPEVRGFVFVVGPMALPADERSVKLATRLSAKLSARVQYFFTHRVVEQHGWLLAVKGVLARAYAYSGESGRILFDIGKRTEAERALVTMRITERTVLSIAGAWGISPITLAEIEQSGDGYGRLADIGI